MGWKRVAEKEALLEQWGGLLASLTWTYLQEESINLGTQGCCRHVSRAPPRGILQYSTREEVSGRRSSAS